MEFNDELKTGVLVVDEQHRGFFSALDVLRKTINNKFSEDEIEGALLYLEVYSNTHFEAEEYYMSLSKWPDESIHKNEHESFREDLRGLMEQLTESTEDKARLLEIIDFMKQWLAHHINDTDKKFVTYLKEKRIEFEGDLPVQDWRR